MNRKPWYIATVATVLGAVVWQWPGIAVLAQSAAEVSLERRIDNLVSSDRATRDKAVEGLVSQRKGMNDALVAGIAKMAAPPDLSYRGRLDSLLEVAGSFRVSEAAPQLVRMVHIRLDKDSFPKGDRIRAERLYPAAQALVSIGDRQMASVLVERIAAEDENHVLRPATWVLREVLGVEEARRVLLSEQQGRSGEEARARLGRALSLLQEEVIVKYE